ncbi:hypothetical protein P153DRAFT_363195 [Dothidotthia symphoricarpi CBS 119687]|uniref:Uncharacterized protein n=1 Tax=Dothidotthia symphoricarpi CBS 119687 TaxID=1392245 RepID=A0A6A6ATQ5_9PLEO|nr:uncharacterized protein P153DRAFT_363195 [Dothidotthia symphoricarpi CBS 119687]KAF2134217.1 hypothetical protein P153DRAFT_363195 [Dothidotthia symphoricarpi CBS 119687]
MANRSKYYVSRARMEVELTTLNGLAYDMTAPGRYNCYDNLVLPFATWVRRIHDAAHPTDRGDLVQVDESDYLQYQQWQSKFRGFETDIQSYITIVERGGQPFQDSLVAIVPPVAGPQGADIDRVQAARQYNQAWGNLYQAWVAADRTRSPFDQFSFIRLVAHAHGTRQSIANPARSRVECIRALRHEWVGRFIRARQTVVMPRPKRKHNYVYDINPPPPAKSLKTVAEGWGFGKRTPPSTTNDPAPTPQGLTPVRPSGIINRRVVHNGLQEQTVATRVDASNLPEQTGRARLRMLLGESTTTETKKKAAEEMKKADEERKKADEEEMKKKADEEEMKKAEKKPFKMSTIQEAKDRIRTQRRVLGISYRTPSPERAPSGSQTHDHAPSRSPTAQQGTGRPADYDDAHVVIRRKR